MNLLSPFPLCTTKLCAPSSWGTGARKAGGYACSPCREEHSLANSPHPACRPVQLYLVARRHTSFLDIFLWVLPLGRVPLTGIQYIIPFIHSLPDQLFNEHCLMAVDIGLVLDIQICAMLSSCPWRTYILLGRGIIRVFGVDTVIFKMDNQQGPTVQHRELCSMSCGSLDGRGVWGRMDTCIYGWVPWLFTWHYHNTVIWLYSSIK